MSHPNVSIIDFIYHVRSYLTSLNSEHLAPFLSRWPEPGGATRSVPKFTLPVLSWLPKMIKAATPDTLPIVEQVTALVDQLAWGQTYSPEDFGPSFFERYGWTEVVGLRGIVASNRLACGFLLLGPETEYPLHRHEAEEVYIPLTGGTNWLRGNEGWISREAGRPIVHETWTPHAMRTGAAPLMAVYLWHGGDLTQKSLID